VWVTDESGPIVVGVDGSPCSQQALRWALNEARVHDMGLVVIHAIDMSMGASSPYLGDAWQALREAGEQMLDDAEAEAKDSGIAVERRLDTTRAAHALVEASHDAALLVVGSRGRGGLAGMLLGSVSTACVHHAHCPVVVIRPPS
jgi:nucleotide-binding universal stress UspA family protein